MIEQSMTVQQAAKSILETANRPMSSRELAQTILRKRLMKSEAKDPERSYENTLNQNIELGREPILVEFQGRNNEPLLGLPEWKDKVMGEALWWEDLKIKVTPDLYRKLQLAQQAGLRPSFEETVVMLLESGLKQQTENIKNGLLTQIAKLEENLG